MKKKNLLAIATIFSLVFISAFFTSCDKEDNSSNETVVPITELPTKSQLFITDYFKGFSVQSTEKGSSYYNVSLAKSSMTKAANATGYKIKFGFDGEWIEIDGKDDSALPESVLSLVPSTIVAYVAEFHVGRSITEIEKTSYGYFVDLTGNPDVELQFDTMGKIIKSSVGDNDDDDQIVQENNLPAAINNFLSTHYSGISVVKATIDDDSYDVDLANSAELEFYLNGNWKEIDVNQSTIPASIMALLPNSINSYLNANYSGRKIEEVKKGVSSFKIELNGDVELVFDKDGNLWKNSNPVNNDGSLSDGENRVDISSLPQKAQDMLNSYFLTAVSLLFVEQDDDEYEIKLSDGTKIEFQLNGDLKKVEVLPGKAVPSGVILPAISNYVNANYPNNKIEEYEIEGRGYKVDLSGYADIELLFDSNGAFIGLDN